MIGTLIDIAKGNINKTILDIINSKQREIAGQTAPAHGLYLKKIEYLFFNYYEILKISS